MHREYMAKLNLDERELTSRRTFFQITDEDLKLLTSARATVESLVDEVVEGFYELLLDHPETRKFFPDEGTIRRVKRTQRDYFMRLFSGVVDLDYVEDRLRVGFAHERIGMPAKWYCGAYRRYMQLMFERLMPKYTTPEMLTLFQAVQKLVWFDVALAMDTYIAANLDTLKRHQAAIRELSTPVIRVYDRVLLLPLIGTIDSQRALQVMETALVRVIDEQARVVIVDIAGVPVVDTAVADHLLKATAAIRLLGAQTILTGISAQVARTIVQLGVDISSMQTRNRLADGIELALALVGKEIAPVGQAATARAVKEGA